MFSWTEALLALLPFLPTAQAGIIENFHSCVTPYLIPRKFQQVCDASDIWISQNSNLISDPQWKYDLNYTGRYPDFITSRAISSKPSIWTIEPWCLESNSAKDGFCVYTNANFGLGRGISVISTPSEIVDVLKTNAFSEDLTQWEGANRDPASEDRFYSTPVPNKGIGVLAKKPMHRGERIQGMSPVIIISDTVNEYGEQWEKIQVLRIAVERLPKKSRDLYMALHGEFGGDPYYDRYDTNSFTMLVGKKPTGFAAVIPEASRFNHACRPNAHYYLDPDTMLQEIHASRTITQGEEITVTYINPVQPYENRRNELHRHWGFECSCSLCSASVDDKTLSDTRIRLIREVSRELDDQSAGRPPRTASAELLVSLFKSEGLTTGAAHEYAALEYAFAGEKRMAQKHAGEGLEEIRLWHGWHSHHYKIMERLFRNPERHEAWKYLERKKA